jgi:hypothetical protein
VHGGESVRQLPLKDKAFTTFLVQNPPFVLRPERGVASKNLFRRCPVFDNNVIKRLAKGKLQSRRPA